MRSFFVLLFLGVVLATIALVVRSGLLARKNPGEPINAAMRLAMDTPQFSTEDAAIINRQYNTAHKLPSGLLYMVRDPGHGPVAKRGSLVTLEYEGRLLDGTKFDSSRDRGHPLVVEAGLGKVIKGMDEALLTMREGEKRTLIIPYWLGYGDASQGNIPARATLVFDVDILSIH